MQRAQKIVQQLDLATERIPVDQLIAELQIVIERISFSRIHESTNEDSKSYVTDQIDLLFRGEVSPGVLAFVQWMASQGFLAVLAGDTGLAFLGHCVRKYTNLTQVRFITAVVINESLKEYISQTITKRYPRNSRLVFETNAGIIAGFVIDDGTKVVDKSLQSLAAKRLRPRIAETVGVMSHG